MIIPPVTGVGHPSLYLIVTTDGNDKPLTIPTWATDYTVAQEAARRYNGVVYRAQQLDDYTAPAQVVL